MTFSGEFISSSIPLDAKNPTIPTINPFTTAKSIDVCVVLDAFSGLFAPIARAITTFVPIEKPINKLVIRLMREPVEPTAASDCLPANCPTTTTSAALNRS